jgi:putative transposase
MSKQRYPEEFKVEAVRQISVRGHKVADASARHGVSLHSLYQWIKAMQMPPGQRQAQGSQADGLRRLRAELKRVTEERHVLKMGRRLLCQAVRVRYAFIKLHEHEHSVRRMCEVTQLHPSGYCAWKVAPNCCMAQDEQRLLGLLKQAWLKSGGVYGYCKHTLDMRDSRETCGKHRVFCLLKQEGCACRLATAADLAHGVASLLWSHRTICSASSRFIRIREVNLPVEFERRRSQRLAGV